MIFIKQLYKATKNKFVSGRSTEFIPEVKKTFKLTDNFIEKILKCKPGCITDPFKNLQWLLTSSREKYKLPKIAHGALHILKHLLCRPHLVPLLFALSHISLTGFHSFIPQIFTDILEKYAKRIRTMPSIKEMNMDSIMQCQVEINTIKKSKTSQR